MFGVGQSRRWHLGESSIDGWRGIATGHGIRDTHTHQGISGHLAVEFDVGLSMHSSSWCARVFDRDFLSYFEVQYEEHVVVVT